MNYQVPGFVSSCEVDHYGWLGLQVQVSHGYAGFLPESNKHLSGVGVMTKVIILNEAPAWVYQAPNRQILSSTYDCTKHTQLARTTIATW